MNKKKLIVILLALYLGTYGNQLALWQEGQEDPIRIYPYNAEIYTETDLNKLKNGIKIYGSGSLQTHLDDFQS